MTVNISFDEAYPSDWVKASDIPDGKNRVLTIKDVTFEPLGREKQMKLVLHFAELDKSLALNKTNGRTLESLFGKDPNAAIGKQIGLYSTPVTYAGVTSMGVRINPNPVPARATKPAPQPVQKPQPKTQEQLLSDLGYDEPLGTGPVLPGDDDWVEP